MRPCVTIEGFASIRRAIESMREAGQEVIPVTQDGKFLGLLTQSSIVRILSENAGQDEPVERFVELADTIVNRITGAEALRQLEKNQTLVVVDDFGVVCGLLTPSCFIATPQAPERPHMVGGMATPFGVYLTTGSVRGGKDGWALFFTGMFLMVLYFGASQIYKYVGQWLPHTWPFELAVFLTSILVARGIFRLLPISGYHAAEHMVVHAFERDEELTPEIIARMPRVHPRCGTNIAVAVTMFSLIFTTRWVPNEETRMLVAVLATLFLWKPVGSFVQYWFTTKKPNAEQIASGIAAGNELLANYATAKNRSASLLTRIINSGMLHVIAGSFAALGIALLIGLAFGVDLLQS